MGGATRPTGSTAHDLLERKCELDRIAEALARASAGTGQLVLTEGVAGVGKTELLRAAKRTARENGMRVLSAQGVELERDHAFGVARQLFGPVLRDAGDDKRDLLAGAAALTRPLLDGSPPSDTSDGEFPFLHGFFWLVATSASAGRSCSLSTTRTGPTRHLFAHCSMAW